MPRVRVIHPAEDFYRIKHYGSFNGIQAWIIRNLMVYGNCCFKAYKYIRFKEGFEKLFGKRNIIVQDTDKHCVIMSINTAAKNRADKFVLL